MEIFFFTFCSVFNYFQLVTHKVPISFKAQQSLWIWSAHKCCSEIKVFSFAFWVLIYFNCFWCTLQRKIHLVKAMVFPVVMYGCESWTIKKAESQRIDAFELWCWRRLLRVPWTTNRSNQSILKEISPKYSLEGLMLKLKLQYSGHLMRRTASFIGKDPDTGKDWRQVENGTTEDETV